MTFHFPSTYVTSILVLFTFFMSAQEPLDDGGGEMYLSTNSQCISDADRSRIVSKISDQIEMWSSSEELVRSSTSATQSFLFPLVPAAELSWNNFYGVSNYVDHNPLYGSEDWNQYGATNRDYNCGNITYDTRSGYNHSGTDYFTWPFPWYLYENELVHVVAAAEGVVGKDDGNTDRNCTCRGQWNAVYLMHDDGSQTWYGHLKRGRLTDKEVGDRVIAGEYLGVVASSGCSTGPHLHFEVYDAAGNLVDPYEGSCNPTTDDSLWEDQRPYRSPRVNALTTHFAPPQFGCPTSLEATNFKDDFEPGDDLVVGGYFQDQLIGEQVRYTILEPDNSVYRTWSRSFTETFNASWWWFRYSLPINAPCGVWTYTATYLDSEVAVNFTVGGPPDVPSGIIGAVTDVSSREVYQVADAAMESTYLWTCISCEIVEGQGSSSITVDWLEGGGSLCVQESDDDACLGRSFCIDVTGLLSSTGQVEMSYVSIGPNPAKNVLYLNDLPSGWSIEIVDGSGRAMMSTNQATTIVDVTGWSAGLHIVTVRDHQQSLVEVRRLIKL